ncbi:MAG: phosphatase PAP2 family protein [Pseudobdellovibrionaceae bacterium]
MDQKLSLYFKRPELEGIWLMARTVTNVGLSEHYFIIAIFLYIFARWIRPSYTQIREWSRNLFFALITSGIFIHILKFCVGRQRPHKSPDFNPFVFHPFTTNWDFHSFGSGHTQVLFTVATMLSLALPKVKWVFFALAALFAFTRVIIHDHFLSDYIAGAVVGYVGTLTAVFWVNRWLSRRKNVSTNP